MATSFAKVLCLTFAVASAEALHANPIRKVVTMMQDMQNEIEAEGEKEKKLFDAYMCYCEGGAAALETSIKTAAAQIDSIAASIDSETAEKAQLEQDVVQHKADRVEAEKTIKESTAMRGKEASEFASISGEMKGNIEAMNGALAALKKGLSASLLQTSAGRTLRSIVERSPAISEAERDNMLAFLQDGEGTAGSDQIIGIVSQMGETMEADLKEATATEEEAKAAFTTLMASKESEISAATKAVEGKTAKAGELAVSLVQNKNDLEDTKDAKADDEEMKASLATGCATKAKEWDERCKSRALELQAISETIEMLNGDDALELFKKTLPSAPALIQVSANTRLKATAKDAARSRRKFLMLQTRTGSGTKNAIAKIIGDLIAANDRKQEDDDKQKAFCVKELAASEKAEKALDGTVADLETQIAKKEDEIAAIVPEIEALQQGLLDLDKSVAEATEQRKNEHAEYLATSAANQAAMELIGMAKNRMQKFYNPSQYKAPPTTTEDSSPYFLQLREPVGAPPPTFEGEVKKNEGATGVLAMMDDIIRDIETDMAEAKHEEEVAQKDYEKAMKDAAKKRPADSKLIVEKTDAKATEETNLQTLRTSLASARKELREAQKKHGYLQGMCDNFLSTYDDRTQKRASERQLLVENQEVLKDVESVFLQP